MAGFFYLYQTGCRIIDTEVSGFMSKDDYERWKNRSVIEVTGSRRDKLEQGICPFCGNKIEEVYNNRYLCIARHLPKAKIYGKENKYYKKYKKLTVEQYDSLTMEDEYCSHEYWKKNGKWYRWRKSNSKNQIIDCAGLDKAKYDDPKNAKIKGVEAKASYNDFKSGFCTGADITYIISPEGTIPKEEIPKYIGLLEVDLDKLKIVIKPEVHVVGLNIKKRATTNKSEMFRESNRNDRIYSFIEKIARRGTMTKVFGDYYPTIEK